MDLPSRMIELFNTLEVASLLINLRKLKNRFMEGKEAEWKLKAQKILSLLLTK